MLKLKKSPVAQYNEIKNWIDTNVNIRDITKTNYNNLLKKINELLNLNAGEFSMDRVVQMKNELLEYFSVNTKTKDNQLTFLLMCYRILNKPPPSFLTDLKQQTNNQIEQVNLQKATKELSMEDYSDVLELFNKYTMELPELLKRSKKMHVINEYIALSFYSLLPPFRPNDILDLAIVYDDPEDNINYLNLNKKKLFYTMYKTSGTYGDIELDVPDKLVEILCTYYNMFRDINGYKYIFTTDTGKIVSTQNFSKLVKGIKGLNMSPNDLRNLYVSSIKDKTMDERALIAKYMKHSLSSQLLIYNKYNKNNI